MIKNTIKIAIVVLGLIVGSVATIKTNIVPTFIDYSTNEDVKILISESGSKNKLSTINLEGKSILPIHYENGTFYYSPTLKMDNLQPNNPSENIIYNTYDIRIDKNYENVGLETELVIDGEDTLNKAIRVMLSINGISHILTQESCSQSWEIALNQTSATCVRVWMWYELEDENVTIENINNANGAEVSLNFYANIME